MSRSPRVRVTSTTAARRPASRTAAPARRRSANQGSVLPRLPIAPETLRRMRNWTLGLFVAAAVLGGLVAMGVPGMIGMAAAHGLGQLGFTVRNVQVTGIVHADRDTVYRIASEQKRQDMPLVDLSDLRRQLLQIGWIEDARVSRRLPDTLAIDLVERVPAAVLQRNQQLSLIDTSGHVLAALDVGAMPTQLPLVIGDGVEQHIVQLQQLIASQAPLKALIEGATWVGNRRWDLRFQSGEVLSLPEGDDAAKAALAAFARKDQEARLLGQGYPRIDMRDPAHIVIRTSRDPGSKVADPAPAAATQA